MSHRRLPGAADDRQTYFAHALALSAAHGPGPWPDGGYPLPDEDRPMLMSGSVHDGIRTHHFSFTVDHAAAVEAAEAIAAVTSNSLPIEDLHDLLAGHDALTVADAMGDEIRTRNLRRPQVREVGRWLAEHGTRRNSVAIGLVLLGLTGDERDREMLLLLGGMEELTLYAVVALRRTQSDRDTAVFELAQRVRDWGRIHTVERLEHTTDPEIKAWLLREGFRNGVMYEYLALIAATTGDLAGALMEPEVDDALLDGAGAILAALSIEDGPAKGISHYPDATVAIDRYLTLVRNHPSLQRIRAVLALDDYLRPDSRLQELLADPAWVATVRQALDGPDLDTFRLALWPAEKLGLQTQDRVVSWLEREPFESLLWHHIKDVDRLIELAERLLPLPDLATGPALEDGIGKGFAADHALDTVVSTLSKHPGRGWPLINAALSNRVIRNRNMAINALKAWPDIPAEALAAVRAAMTIEPADQTRQGMAELLEKP